MHRPPHLDPGAGARPSFEDLYAVARSYLPDPLRLLKVPAEDVDDLIHDVVLVAYRGLDRYAPRPALPGERPDPVRTLKAWLSGIAWRQVVKRRGRAHRRLELPAGDGANLPTRPADDAPNSEQLAAEAQRRRILEEVLRKLRPERAEVLVLHDFLEMPVPDIAAELAVNENTVKSRLLRARADVVGIVKRLSEDERSALEGSPLVIPFALVETSWSLSQGEESRSVRPPSLSLPPHPHPTLPPSTGTSRALLAGTLLLGIALGAGLAQRREPPPPAELRPIAAAQETAAAPPSSPQTAGALPNGATSPVAAPSAPRSARPRARPIRRGDPLTRESALLDEARGALLSGDKAKALGVLAAHERDFPDGALAADRAWLQREVARLR